MADAFEEKAAWCALNTVFGFEPQTGHRLAEALEGPGAVFHLTVQERRQLLGPSKFLPQLSLRTLDEAVRAIQTNTRHYAKRQLTWWRRDPSIRWITL